MRTVFRAIQKFLHEADIFLLSVSLVSAVFGIVILSSVFKNPKFGGNEIYVQISALIIGLVLFVLFSYIDIDIIADKYGFLFVFCMFFIATLFQWGVGMEEVGDRGWLRFWGVGIQPVEVVKVPFIIIIAKMIVNSKERKSLDTFLSIMKILLVTACLLGLTFVASSDVGNPLIYIIILLIMLFIGGMKLRWFFIGGGVVAAMIPLIWSYLFEDYHRDRIQAPFFPDRIDPTRQWVLWQPDLSVRAIGSGGFQGQGLGSGRITQAALIPGQHTDFVFSAAGEELGFIGCTLIMLLLVVIIIRCFYVGAKSNNPLGMLVCTGVSSMLIAQMLLNIGMCLGILPVIGITLPFFSYGGSSIVTTFAAMGIVSGIRMRPKPVRFRTI